ncbi:hypothetical protein ACH474_13575 [Nocardia rhamnosiphila]|uniref:Uncharacterized protein n=1 Tax=Nocardia rhamnosiphila TaxID=426716 RepID=A0ABV2WU56_9NOCA|nr:hypothetical protein [Nocardia rhamnosiphila]
MFNHIPRAGSLTGLALVLALGLPAGPAHADPFPPGVSCSGTTCRNDTDQHYLVESRQECKVVDGYLESSIPFNVMLKPHETVQVTGVECSPLIYEDRHVPNRHHQIPREPVGISYDRAVPYDPNAKPPTGSAF